MVMVNRGFAGRAGRAARSWGGWAWAAEALAAAVCAGSLLPAGAAAQHAPEAGRFVPNGAEVTDTLTGLVWRRCSEAQSWTGSTCSGSAGNYTWQDALGRAKAAGAPWRLPDAKELASLVDASRVGPAIDTAAFPGTPSTGYWTSTHYAGDASYAWGVYFYGGHVYGYYRSGRGAVRLVRAGQ